MKNRKAAGPDGITAELLTGAGQIAEKMTIVLIRRVWSEGHVPQVMKHANIVLIPKTNLPTTLPEDQRPISLLNMWYKVLDRIVKDRIEKDIAAANTLSDEQAGFRAGKTCQDQIFILETIADIAKSQGKPLY